jgi:hypothetical protein
MMAKPENNNPSNPAAEFLSGDLTEAHLNDAEMDAIVGGADLKANGNVQAAKSVPVLNCWPECTRYISGCVKLTT